MIEKSVNKTQLLVIGAGPGGYPAAFLAADLGMQVTMVDLDAAPGGVCLYRGCIPSKALLHVARLINEAAEASHWGIEFGAPKIELERLRKFKNDVIGKMTGGLSALSKMRKVKLIQGRASFLDATTVSIERKDGQTEQLSFEYAIVATGSQPTRIPSLWIDKPNFMDSTGALELNDIPETLLVVGGGYIGLEMATVYAALGSKVTVVEMTPGLLPGADRDLVEPLQQRLSRKLHAILLDTKLESTQAVKKGIKVKFSGKDVKEPEQTFEKVLFAIGRRPNAAGLGLENTKVKLDARGFIAIDRQCRTGEPNIFALGDVAGEPMLAHKATAEARVAVEAIAGKPGAFEPRAIPAVVFTDPEIAWAGLTESEAEKKGLKVKVARFPWAASGRATSIDRNDGLTKLVIEPSTDRILGVGIVGAGAGELIAEGALAIEMGATATDLQLTIHPHPTLSETLMEAAEVFYGHSPHYKSRK